MPKLPEDFPGRKALEANGTTTRAQVEKLSDDELKAIDGIGPKTFDEIRAYNWTAGEDADTAAAPANEGEGETHKGENGTITQVIR